MKHRLLISVILVLVLSLSLLAACGQNNSSDATEEGSAEVMTDDSGDTLKVIGIKAGSNTFVTLKNKTGQDIRDIAIKASTDGDYAAGLLAASDALKNNESRVLYYTLAEDKNVTYDVQLSLADGTHCVLHSFPFNDTKSCTIWLDGAAYIEYLSNGTGKMENSRAMELNILLAQEEGITLEQLNAQQGNPLKIAATPSPSPSSAVNNNAGRSNYSGRTNGGSYYNGGGTSGGGSSNNNSGGGSSESSSGGETDNDGGSSGGDSSGDSSGGSSGGTIGGDEAYMDDDLSGSTVD